MGLRGLFRPHEFDLIGMLVEQAQKTRQGLAALETFSKTGDEGAARQVIEAELEADELRRILTDELNRTFVTPIDREDIFALSRAIDDMMDYAFTTIDEMTMFKLQPTKSVSQLATILREASDEIYFAVLRLKEHPNVALDHASKVKSLENQAERIYREAIAELFETVRSLEDVVYILKMREVYRHLSNAADRGDEAGNVIGNIVVKMS